MSNGIDADEVLEHIRKKLGIKSFDYLLEAERQIVDAIQSAPSIDIVRCRECKHFWKYSDLPTKCVFHLSLVNANDFCSYGDKRND